MQYSSEFLPNQFAKSIFLEVRVSRNGKKKTKKHANKKLHKGQKLYQKQ